MKLRMRTYRDESDYWRIREFLRRVFLLNDRREKSWPVARLDYWRGHNFEKMRPQEVIFIWETADSQIAAVLNPETRRSVFLQVHPNLCTPEVEAEMLAIAEKRLGVLDANGRHTLWVWTDSDDAVRQDILTRRGYTKVDYPELQRRRPLSMPVPDVPVAAGYMVRALGDVEELPARSWASWRAFHPDAPDAEYEGWHWYHGIQRAPLYRRDLDVVAVAPTGEFASFCTLWFDDVTRSAYVEPVGTAPEHRRRGLGKAVICEGLRRVERLGATIAYVGSYEEPAHTLYASVGFTQYDLSEPWEKEV